MYLLMYILSFRAWASSLTKTIASKIIAIDLIYFRNLGSRLSQPFLVGLNAFVFKAQKRLFCTFVETNGKRGFGRHAQNSVKFTEAVTSYQTSQAAILT